MYLNLNCIYFDIFIKKSEFNFLVLLLVSLTSIFYKMYYSYIVNSHDYRVREYVRTNRTNLNYLTIKCLCLELK